MGNRPTKPHVTGLAMHGTPDIVTVSLTPNDRASAAAPHDRARRRLQALVRLLVLQPSVDDHAGRSAERGTV